MICSKHSFEIKIIRKGAYDNRPFFSAYTFIDRTFHFLITKVISKLLQTNCGFQKIEEIGEVILSNSNVNFRF